MEAFRAVGCGSHYSRTWHLEDSTMRAPIFGLSTTPVMDIKSELRLQLERDMLALVYRLPR
jgi:hypothetical protein